MTEIMEKAIKKESNNWHLTETAKELEVTEFELQLWRVFHGFLRWQEDCEKAANENTLTGQELSVLHVIRMMDRPKSIIDIGRILNREDTFNITYSIKKLLKLGLIEKTKGSVKKGATYQVSAAGIINTEALVKARKKLLISSFIEEDSINLLEMTKMLAKIKGIYDEAGRLAACYKDVS